MKAKKIITYSALERQRHGIKGAGTYVGIFLFMFPFISILLALFSCFIYYLSDSMYSTLFIAGTILLTILFLVAEIRWLWELLTVYVAGEDGELYRLHISIFWYKIKGCTNLLNPMNTAGGKWMQIFYMIQNIKLALEGAGDISFDELIQMGRLTRITSITEVENRKKSFVISAEIENQKGIRKGKISIRKVYDHIDALQEYADIYKNSGKEAAEAYNFRYKKNASDYMPGRTSVQKLLRFLTVWTGIILWLALFTVYPDLNKLSHINSGRYQKTEAYADSTESQHGRAFFLYNGKDYVIDVKKEYLKPDGEGYTVSIYFDTENPQKYFCSQIYGLMYKPVFIIYFAVIILYLISGISQYFIDIIVAKKRK
ncbi:MAG: hypothetical protein HFI34_00665 [Lachnospiraceae bacterium]|nr:hypothetical protein [Lachnospiraceae bacterium]